AIDEGSGSLQTIVPTGVGANSFAAVDTVNHVAYLPRTGVTSTVERISDAGLLSPVSGLPHHDGLYSAPTYNPATGQVLVQNLGARLAGGSDALPGFLSVINASSANVVASMPSANNPSFTTTVDEAANKVYTGALGTNINNTAALYPGGLTTIDVTARTATPADMSQI